MLLKLWRAPTEQRFLELAYSIFAPTAALLWIIYAALREGFAAHCKYENLRSRGIPHDRALKEALGVHARRPRMRKITCTRLRYPVSAPCW